MTQTILIGKNRRITLDELYALSCGEAKLEMTIHSDSSGGGGDGEADANNNNQTSESGGGTTACDDEESSLLLVAALKNLSLNSGATTAAATDAAAAAEGGGELLSEGATIASLALLSLTLSQGRVIRGGDCASQLSSALVDLVNAILLLRDEGGPGVVLPANGTEFASSVNALLQNQDGVIAVEDKPYLGRLILLARVSLMLAQGTFYFASTLCIDYTTFETHYMFCIHLSSSCNLFTNSSIALLQICQ